MGLSVMLDTVVLVLDAGLPPRSYTRLSVIPIEKIVPACRNRTSEPSIEGLIAEAARER